FIDNQLTIPVTIFGNTNCKINAIIDTGSRLNIINENFLANVHYRISNDPLPLIQTIGGELLSPLQAVEFKLQINDKCFPIIAYVLKNVSFQLLLSLKTCQQAELSFNFLKPSGQQEFSSEPVRV